MIDVNITQDSHMDHAMSEAQRDYALSKIRSGQAEVVVGEAGPAFFIARVELPAELGKVPCALRGPIVGDAPIENTYDAVRVFGGKERPNTSRMTLLPPVDSSILTAIIVGGNLVTLYGGPLAPKEPGDPYLTEGEREESEAFWAEHALSAECFESAE